MVSLSGDAAAALRSSTLACSLPAACLSAAATRAVGAFSARRRRYSPKSRLCAVTVLLASSGGTFAACEPADTSSTAPAFMRLMLPPTNAFGLARSSATSIWSSETSAGLYAPAILLAVSPGRTVTWSPVPVPPEAVPVRTGASAAVAGAGATAAGRSRRGTGGTTAGAAAGGARCTGGAALICGASGTTGAAA